MAYSQFTLNADPLFVLGAVTPTTTLSGVLNIDYNGTPTVNGSLDAGVVSPALGAQVYNNFTIAPVTNPLTGLTTGYTITGTNGVTTITLNYNGQNPVATNVVVSAAGLPVVNNANATVAAVVLPCFAAGTLIRTSRGEVAVEDLRIGDMAVTNSGTSRRIVWLGSSDIDIPRMADPLAHQPIRIAADAFAPGMPYRDLTVSPGHALCVSVLDEVLVPAGVLINDATIVRLDETKVTYWHVELDAHDILYANGLPAESYINVGNRGFFTDRTGQVDLARTSAVLADYCRPYVAEGAVVRALRERLQARAVALGWQLDTSPLAGLHLDVDGLRLEADVDGLTARFRLPAEAEDVWLVSQTAVPSHVADTPDGRRLGVYLGSLVIEDGTWSRTVDLEDSLLSAGFHGAERTGDAVYRWTAGRARLPSALWRDLSGELQLQVELAAPSVPRWVPPADLDTRAHEVPSQLALVKRAA